MRTILIILLWFVFSQPIARTFAGFEIVAEFDEAPGNITVTPSGRIIMSLHQFYEPKYSVVEVLADNSIVPFPNAALNLSQEPQALKLDSVLGIKADSNGTVWMLDNGLRSGTTPKLVAWDTQTDKLHKVIYLPAPVAPKNAFVNDLVIDNVRKRVFITDPAGGSNAALIVVNLQSGSAQRVLEGHQSVLPEKVDLMINRRPLRVKDQDGKVKHPRIGVNPIAMDSNNEWVYFGAMHGQSLYRIRTNDLANPASQKSALAERVERYSPKPISDGITMDKSGRIYLGELAENAIGVITPKRTYKRLAQSPKLSWVDSLAISPKGAVYAVVNRLHLSAPLNGGKRISKPPYYLIRINPKRTN